MFENLNLNIRKSYKKIGAFQYAEKAEEGALY